MTVKDFENEFTQAYDADITWNRDQLKGAIYKNTNTTFTDEENGSLTVKPLANGDSDVYVKKTVAQLATDNHYLGQAAAIDDANSPFPTIKTELDEHPDNAGRILAFVPPGLTTDVRNLTDFHDLDDEGLVIPGDDETRMSRARPTIPFPGMLIGVIRGSNTFVIEWDGLEANRIVAVTERGPRAIGYREEAEATLQGFRPQAEREDYPYFDQQWFRIRGYGANNRVGAVVMEIEDATYDIPSGYEAAIP